MIRGSAWRAGAGVAGGLVGVGTAALLLRHLGVAESGRYVTVISLLAIPVAVADIGLNVSGSRWLALREPAARRRLTADLLGQRLVVMPLALLLVVLFAVAVGYPPRMVGGTMWVAMDPPSVNQAPQDGILNINDFAIRGEPALNQVVE